MFVRLLRNLARQLQEYPCQEPQEEDRLKDSLNIGVVPGYYRGRIGFTWRQYTGYIQAGLVEMSVSKLCDSKAFRWSVRRLRTRCEGCMEL